MSLCLENLFLDVFLNALANGKEILENMNDLWADLFKAPHYEQHKNRCQKSASALILITPREQGYESDSLGPLRCINSSHWYSLFLIQHNKRMSLKHNPAHTQPCLTILRRKSRLEHLEGGPRARTPPFPAGRPKWCLGTEEEPQACSPGDHIISCSPKPRKLIIHGLLPLNTKMGGGRVQR